MLGAPLQPGGGGGGGGGSRSWPTHEDKEIKDLVKKTHFPAPCGGGQRGGKTSQKREPAFLQWGKDSREQLFTNEVLNLGS